MFLRFAATNVTVAVRLFSLPRSEHLKLSSITMLFSGLFVIIVMMGNGGCLKSSMNDFFPDF